jgi:heme/copper-type cytochrome/quinol oxidase subunit 4
MSIFFQTIFLLILIYISYKTNLLLLFNYIIGFLLILFSTNIYFERDVRDKSEIIIFLFNLSLYSILFCSSLFIYFDKEDEKRHFVIVPVFTYCVLVLLEILIFKFPNPIFSIFFPIALAFFLLYILKYYRKYIKEKNS